MRRSIIRGISILTASAMIALFASCARAPFKNRTDAMRPADPPPLADDLPWEPLFAAVEAQAEQLEHSPQGEEMIFGPRRITKSDYAVALRRLIALGRSAPDRPTFFKQLEDEFEFLEVYGQKDWGEVMVTSYYEPWIRGSLKKTAEMTQPLYRVPGDLLSLKLSLFDEKYKDDRSLRGRVENGAVVPYYTREEIDSKGALKNRGLEICWVSPADSFNLQVQGSGVVDFGSGKVLRVGYADKNGHRYESIGNFLKGKIPLEQMSLQTIEAYLATLPPEKRQEIYNRNRSYVFFKTLEINAPTFVGLPATEGRTIATDRKVFPKGALAFLMTEKPRFADAMETSASADPVVASQPLSWEPLTRFVLDQDVGGAIQGPGRVDLFWGRGDSAKRNAGVMKQTGKLYYLIPRQRH